MRSYSATIEAAHYGVSSGSGPLDVRRFASANEAQVYQFSEAVLSMPTRVYVSESAKHPRWLVSTFAVGLVSFLIGVLCLLAGWIIQIDALTTIGSLLAGLGSIAAALTLLWGEQYSQAQI